jgi:hypothetical protein
LSRVATFHVPQKTAREALFEGLHHHRRITPLRFAEEQVYVLGHHHVSNHCKVIAPPDLL